MSGKRLLRVDESFGVALALPAVVDVDVFVAGGLHAVGGHGIAPAARTIASLTLQPKWFQLFQPMGGVAASSWARAAEAPHARNETHTANHMVPRHRVGVAFIRRFPSCKRSAHIKRASVLSGLPKVYKRGVRVWRGLGFLGLRFCQMGRFAAN